MIYLIRHGEPAAGWGAHADPGLSDLGSRQAQATAQILAEAGGAMRAVTSPLARCRETAAPFERLIETHARIEPGVGEVPTPAGIEDRAEWLKGVLAGTWSEAGEPLRAWRQSVMATVDRIPEGTAVFSHFVAINAVVGLLTGEDRCVVFRPGHCAITRIARRGGKLELVQLGSENATEVL
jgi:broad specificity phosphatase PhoE